MLILAPWLCFFAAVALFGAPVWLLLRQRMCWFELEILALFYPVGFWLTLGSQGKTFSNLAVEPFIIGAIVVVVMAFRGVWSRSVVAAFIGHAAIISGTAAVWFLVPGLPE